MSFERGIRSVGEDEAGEPRELSVLSPKVAEANQAQDLVDQLGRALVESHLKALVLPRHVAIGVIHDAQRLFETDYPGYWVDLLLRGESEPVLLMRHRS